MMEQPLPRPFPLEDDLEQTSFPYQYNDEDSEAHIIAILGLVKPEEPPPCLTRRKMIAMAVVLVTSILCGCTIWVSCRHGACRSRPEISNAVSTPTTTNLASSSFDGPSLVPSLSPKASMSPSMVTTSPPVLMQEANGADPPTARTVTSAPTVAAAPTLISSLMPVSTSPVLPIIVQPLDPPLHEEFPTAVPQAATTPVVSSMFPTWKEIGVERDAPGVQESTKQPPGVAEARQPDESPGSLSPTALPSSVPSILVYTSEPSSEAYMTLSPISSPTKVPSGTPSLAPSLLPSTRMPTSLPSQYPTTSPTSDPTRLPTEDPSSILSPSISPTWSPVRLESPITLPVSAHSISPSNEFPSVFPSVKTARLPTLMAPATTSSGDAPSLVPVGRHETILVPRPRWPSFRAIPSDAPSVVPSTESNRLPWSSKSDTAIPKSVSSLPSTSPATHNDNDESILEQLWFVSEALYPT